MAKDKKLKRVRSGEVKNLNYDFKFKNLKYGYLGSFKNKTNKEKFEIMLKDRGCLLVSCKNEVPDVVICLDDKIGYKRLLLSKNNITVLLKYSYIEDCLSKERILKITSNYYVDGFIKSKNNNICMPLRNTLIYFEIEEYKNIKSLEDILLFNIQQSVDLKGTIPLDYINKMTLRKLNNLKSGNHNYMVINNWFHCKIENVSVISPEDLKLLIYENSNQYKSILLTENTEISSSINLSQLLVHYYENKPLFNI